MYQSIRVFLIAEVEKKERVTIERGNEERNEERGKDCVR
jgi:hypothetical protein